MNTLMTRDGHLSDLTLERYAAGEFQGQPQMEEIKAHLAKCALCQNRYEAICADQAALNLTPPANESVGARPWFRHPAMLTPAIAVAAAFAFFAIGPYTQQRQSPETPMGATTLTPDTFRIKGGFDVEFFIKNDKTTRRAEPGLSIYPGDRVGFRVSTKASGHLLIAGMDGQGEPYLCYPQDGEGKSSVIGPSDQPQTLDQAVELDEVLGTETFVALFCDGPITFEGVSRALQERQDQLSAASRSFLKGCKHRFISLQKISRETQ